MLNPVKEAIYSATYVDNYIDSVENLPDDVQRHLSRIRDIDVQYRNLLRNVDHYYDLWCTLKSSNETSSTRRSKAINRMQQTLIQAQELGDEKMKIVNQLQELIAHKTRQLDTDQKNLDIKEELQQQLQGHYSNDQSLDDSGGGGGSGVGIGGGVNNGSASAGGNNAKRSRTQSPNRDLIGLNNSNSSNNHNGNGYDRNLSNSKDSYGHYMGNAGGANGQDQNSSLDRSLSNGNTLANSSSGNNLSMGNANASNSEQIRGAGGKRARRRNDTVNMDICNDSNSPNETGNSSLNERNMVQGRSSNLNSSGSQKKNVTQNQSSLGGSNSGSASGNLNNQNNNSSMSNVNSGSGKKKKRKTRGAHAASSAQLNLREEDPQETIDPDEPTYCVCNQISFGEMILCDNDLCPIEWFHFSCVSLVLKPKGRWYCPNCRGDRPNVMKPKAQFLKELERYNKEKEEKT